MRNRCIVAPKHPFAIISMAFMALSLIARLVYYVPEGLTGFDWWVYLGIPGFATVWFPVALLIWGRKTLLPTCVSVFGGVFYFIVKAFTFAHWWHTSLCICLYLAVLVLYCLTVTGVIPTKKLLYPLFGLPLAFHLFVEDVKNYVIPGAPFHTWLPEISVLCIMAALLCVSLAMEKRA
ncbi:MAG: hypothetical protein J6J51_07695 [Clostridia bacterium]|nr:hypothetical protein [Clostridia bacterium]